MRKSTFPIHLGFILLCHTQMAWLQSKLEEIIIGSKVVWAWHLKTEQEKQLVFLLLCL